MDEADFTELLAEYAIPSHIAGKSIKVRDCPACGSSDFKVHFDRFLIKKAARQPNDPFMGRCYHGSCQTGFSSVSYLFQMGADKVKVLAAHGLDPDSNLRGIIPELTLTTMKPTESAPTDQDAPVDLSGFINFSAWTTHPVVKYAEQRGARSEHYDSLMIDPTSNAVVFVVRDGERVVGYQKRFVKPRYPKFKTQSSDGFRKTQHLLTFPRAGAKIVVCEGPFTAIAAHRYGYHAVCTFGSGISDRQIELLINMALQTGADIGIGFDPDAAGAKGLAKIRSAFYWRDLKVFRVAPDTDRQLPAGYDLSDALKDGLKCKEIAADEWAGPAIADIQRIL